MPVPSRLALSAFFAITLLIAASQSGEARAQSTRVGSPAPALPPLSATV